MNFNSSSFALFMAVIAVAYALCQWRRSLRAQNVALLVASYLFYGSWDRRFLFLILFSTAVDYCCGLVMGGREVTRKVWWGLVGALCLGGALLNAPIDWLGIRDVLLPTAAAEGGWIEPTPWRSLFLAGGDWVPFLCSLGATLAFCLALQLGLRCSPSARRKYFLLLSLISNLTLLGFFKYYDFMVESLAQTFGLDANGWTLGIMVPVGISFYTFQTLSYTIDIYRGHLEPTDDLLDFALFVAFFPQLVAGPIERARVLLPQLQRLREFDWSRLQVGTYLVAWGLFKKIYIADNLAEHVDPVYTEGATPTGPQTLFATYAFAFQIYCDFSGYTDIARGIARMMGVELMINFNVPYISKNPREFWRRWHISLSTWLRDYLYISLGGNRGGPWFSYRNLMLTMVLGGLWHGARMNFVLWGVYQGGLLCLHRFMEPQLNRVRERWSAPTWTLGFFEWLVFFHFVCFGWLLFRVETGEHMAVLVRSLGTGWSQVDAHLGLLARVVWFTWPLLVVQFFQVRSNNLLAPLTWPWPVRAAFWILLVHLTLVMGAFEVTEFIYFQF